MKQFKSLNKGRIRIWWLTHNHRPVLAAILIAAIASLIFYYECRLQEERKVAALSAELLKAEQIARGLPRTMFLIEASTIPQAQNKLARVSNDLDLARHGMGRK